MKKLLLALLLLAPITAHAQCVPSQAKPGQVGCYPQLPSVDPGDWLFSWRPSSYPNSASLTSIPNLLAYILANLPPPTPPAMFGAATDGNVTVSSPITLTRDMAYGNLTITGAGSINTAGFTIYVAGTLDLSNAAAGAITNNGASGTAAVGATAGTGSPAAYGLTTSAQGSAPAGKGGPTGANGTNGLAGACNIGAASVSMGGASQAAGAGGASGTPHTGGIGNSSAALTAIQNLLIPPNAPLLFVTTGASSVPYAVNGGCSGPSGGSGAGDVSFSGGGSGGGGAGAGGIRIFAWVIARGTNTAQSIIQAKGGNGGAGGAAAGGTAGGGGGSSGGGGGWEQIVAGSLTGSPIINALDVSGGNGGAGGNGASTGGGGQGGGGGNGGGIQVTVLATHTATQSTFNVAGAAGTAATGATGGPGGAGGVQRANL